MTIKQLRSTTAPYIEIEILYGDHKITLLDNDKTTLKAFGSFLIEYISIKDVDTITAALVLKAVKE